METLSDASQRLRIAIDLYGAAESMMRQNLLRRHPEASERKIEELLLHWLAKRDETPRGPGTTSARDGE